MRVRLTAALLTIAISGTGAVAQEESARQSPNLSLELNGLTETENGCRLTFVATNGLGADIDRAAYEVAFFDLEGLVQRLTVLDFKSLPEGQTKVRQFDLPETGCETIGRILINGTSACEGPTPESCMSGLQTTTRSDNVDFGT